MADSDRSGPCRAGQSLERSGRAIPWGLSLAAGAFVAAMLLSTPAVLLWDSATGSPTVLGISGLTVSFVVEWSCLLGAAVLGARWAGSNLVGAFGLRLSVWPDVPLGIAVGILFQLAVLPLEYQPVAPLVPHFARRMSAPGRQLASVAHHGPALALLGMLIVVGAPTVEELFFRGLLLRSLEGHFEAFGVRGGDPSAPSPNGGRRAGRWAAAVVSALLFGLAHAEPLQLLGLATFGLALAVMAQRTKRLGPGIVAHAAFNATSFVALTHLH